MTAARYSGFQLMIINMLKHDNFDKYWRMREYVVSHKNLRAYWYLYRIKKADAFNNASLGTHISFNSAVFKSKPILPHGLNGIIVSKDAVIGENVTIYHQVTIGGWGVVALI